MASKLTELSIDCSDPEGLARFWAAVLDYRVTESKEGEWVSLKGPPGSGPELVFNKVPEPKTVKNRIHIDVSASDRDQQEEVERLIELGARRIDIGQGEQSWVVLADPEGNEFCVLRTRVA